MRARVVRVAWVACVACASAKPRPAPPVPDVALADVRPCAEAATGLERGTRSVRPPDTSVVSAMRARCLDDAWPAAAIACFADMTEDDLGRCAGTLPAPARERMLVALGGGGGDRTTVAVARVRLGTLAVGIAECDHFVETVARALACEGLPLATRAQLGSETVEFWSLPTANLSEDTRRRMAAACGKSLTSLRQHVTDAGCMP